MKQPIVKVCHTCGAKQTLRGQPLAGNYCSPLCCEKAYARPDDYGMNQYGKQGYLRNSDKDSK